jgi:hypothetical protein
MFITKMLVGAVIVLGSGVVAVAPASAAPNPSDTHQNPFASLTCSCQDAAPAGGLSPRQQIDRGIRTGLSALP